MHVNNTLLTVSIVVHNSNHTDLDNVLESIIQASFPVMIYLVFNSPSTYKYNNTRVKFIYNSSNIGFGPAHNMVILNQFYKSPYHLILNPDITFNIGTLENLINFMDSNCDIGICMPKILFPDGSIQHLCKLLPTPFDLFLRRFIPDYLFSSMRQLYDFRFTNYNIIMDVPFLSGSFMLARTSILRKIGGFDPSFFMYMEDVDLCRRVLPHARVVFYPLATAYHRYEKGSYRSARLLYYHLRSAVAYFNKWGWIVDKRRSDINLSALRAMNRKGSEPPRT
jgi:GT2 family glycosyltransferase